MQAKSPISAIARVVEGLVRLGRRWLSGPMGLPLAGVLGVLLGLSLVLFQVSNARSYLSDAPEACINCHVMTSYYASWAHGSHRIRATCNDCHVPQTSKVRGLYFKAMDGLRHAWVFTLRREPQVLRLAPGAVPVVQENCIRCHERQVMRVIAGAGPRGRLCWDCHRETPHGRATSLSSSPHTQHPPLPSAGFPRQRTKNTTRRLSPPAIRSKGATK